MARIFISYSSRDRGLATRMKSWLVRQRFESAFLDKDKTTGIPPGADWEKTLYREVELSQAVIVIQTPNWLASKWCFAEFTQARALGKAILPVIEAPTRVRISRDIETLDLTHDRKGGLDRLKHALVRIALDAQGGFHWDATRPPFPGLLSFEEEDAAVYFGRDDDIRRLIERLEARRAQGGAKLIALLGSSGSGKSSLLRAGVIPRLKRAGRNWIVVPPMRPHIRPVDELARALATAFDPPLDWCKLRANLGRSPAHALNRFANDLRVKSRANEAQILIPIDQAEELFGVADPKEGRRFLEILSYVLSDNSPFTAIMALRSDFLGHLQSAESLAAPFEDFSLGPMPIARIPQIIEGPMKIAGLVVEPDFVRQAAKDAQTEDALPLLAFTLGELLNRSTNRSLTLEGYKALGDDNAKLSPLENAVRQAADAVLAGAKPTEDELKALREAFVPAMVRVNDRGEYVRRPALLDALPAKSHPLLERLVNARLLTKRQVGDAPEVEVVHEALLRKWPLLRSWLDSAQEFLIGRQQLEQDLRDWEVAPEKDKSGALLTGLKLNRARGWLVEYPTQLTAQERAFIESSIEQTEAESQSKEIARKTAIANESRALAALSQAANVQGRYTDAVKLALAAWPRSASDERPQLLRTIDALGQALAGPLEVSPPLRQEDTVFVAAFSPDGARVLTASQDNTARLWDAITGNPIGEPWPHEGRVGIATFSPDCARALTVSDKTARIWNATTGAPIGDPMRHESDVHKATFSPDGARVVTASWDKTARVWDAASGAPIGDPMRHESGVYTAEFSRDGARVVTGSDDFTARVWDAASGAPIGSPMRHDGVVFSAAFSSDGARVVTASSDKTARLWDALTGAPIGHPMRHKKEVWNAAFSPDGARAVTGSDDFTARVWDAATGAPIGEPMQHNGRLRDAAFSPDGARVVTASDDETARLWDVATGAPIANPMRHDGAVMSAAFSPDGARILTTSSDRTARVWGAPIASPIGNRMRHEDEVWNAAFSPDGARVVTASWDKTARIWDAATGAPIGNPMQHDDTVLSAAFSRDGVLVVTASSDGTARVWDAATGALSDFIWHHGAVMSAAFSPQANRLVTASADRSSLLCNVATASPDGTARVWDAATGMLIAVGSPTLTSENVLEVTASAASLCNVATNESMAKVLQHEGTVYRAVFSRDGARVVTASSDNTARVWDAATGEPIGKPLRHEGEVRSAVFGPDGKRVATASSDKTARLWDAATGAPIGEPLRHGDSVHTAVFSPDGKRVVTASSDKTARVWDAASGAPIGSPMRHDGMVISAAFSPDGARVVTGSDDFTARVWDAAIGMPIGNPMRHKHLLRNVEFSPDGARVVTASFDKTAQVWVAPAAAPDIIATACKMLGDRDVSGLATRYGISVVDPICGPDTPAPDLSLMIDR